MTSADSLYPVPTLLAEYGCLSSESGSTENVSEVACIYGNVTQLCLVTFITSTSQ